MEIATSPHRPASTPWGRLLLLVVVVGPVSVLVLLPVGLGLQRYVMSSGSMAGDRPDSIGRGALVLEREVPVGDLRVGDVITFRPPTAVAGGDRVTHRIVAIDVRGIRTRGDAAPAPDPWVLQPRGDTLPRVVLVVPWVGYGYLALREPLTWVLVGLAALAAGLLVAAEAARRRRLAARASGRAPRRLPARLPARPSRRSGAPADRPGGREK